LGFRVTEHELRIFLEAGIAQGMKSTKKKSSDTSIASENKKLPSVTEGSPSVPPDIGSGESEDSVAEKFGVKDVRVVTKANGKSRGYAYVP
jgi:hypothetical protein